MISALLDFLGFLLTLSAGLWTGWTVRAWWTARSTRNGLLGVPFAITDLFGLPGKVWGLIAVAALIFFAVSAARSFLERHDGRVRAPLEQELERSEINLRGLSVETESAKAGASDVASRSEQELKTREKVANASRKITTFGESRIEPTKMSSGAEETSLSPDPKLVWAHAIDGLRDAAEASRRETYRDFPQSGFDTGLPANG